MRKRYRLVIEPRLKGGPAMTDREKESCEGDFVIESGCLIDGGEVKQWPRAA